MKTHNTFAMIAGIALLMGTYMAYPVYRATNLIDQVEASRAGRTAQLEQLNHELGLATKTHSIDDTRQG